ncbi:MAG TPA: hypothetical protein VJR02_17410 [Pyrinomonadaceae bacterium]|nr:hypothetical protein [Pyrinomonadaceae bacterium]
MKGLPGGRKVVVLMALNNNDQTRIREYLLGKLNDDEQQKIEERLMVEDDLFQEFEISKGELVEEYRANELSRDEQQWFERNFLASPEGKESYAQAITLDHLKRPAPKPPRPRTFWEKLNDLLKQPWVVATVATTAGIVIVAAIFLSRQTGQTEIGPTLASTLINREKGILPTKISIPSNASEMKFRLVLPPEMSPGANYRAELDNRNEVKPVKVVEHDREGVWVVIPVTQLPRGEYSLKLVTIEPDGRERPIPGDYLFNVD